MKKALFLFLFLSCISFTISAQSDYAVDKKGDTTRGTLRKSLLGKTRLETSDGKMIMDADMISLYYDADRDETYCSRELPGLSENVFIIRLVNGAIKMYSYTIVYNNGTQSFSTTTWYAEKDGIGFDEIKAGGLRGGKDDRKAFFRSLIADNAAVVQQFDEDKKLKLSFLKELIEEYNKKAATK